MSELNAERQYAQDARTAKVNPTGVAVVENPSLGRDDAVDMAAAARNLVEHGAGVLPLHSPSNGHCSCGDTTCEGTGKHPLTGRGVRDASFDVEQVSRWWKMHPQANIGVATGTDMVVLDIDPRNGGHETLATLIAVHGPLPHTIKTKTGGGGFHFWFAVPDGKTVKSPGPGIDVKGRGGYVVAPPSLHPSGSRYEWEVAPWEADPAVIPDWLTEPVPDDLSNSVSSPQAIDRDALMRRLPSELIERINKPDNGRDRSTHAHGVFQTLLEVEPPLSDAEVCAIAEGTPFAAKYAVRNDLAAEIQRQRKKIKRAEAAGEKQVAGKAHTKHKAEADAAAPLSPRDPQNRWNVLSTPANLHLTATRAEDALVKAGAPIYTHGSNLKRPVIEEVDAAKGHRTKIARLASVGEDALRDELSKAAHFYRWDKRAEEWQSTGPPRDVAKVILSREGRSSFPTIAGVITTPTLRPDGSLVCKPGYDPQTRLLLVEPLPVEVPTRPTKENARAALGLLDGLLAEFPFENHVGRSVALSTLITPVVRGALPVAPMHAVSSPAPGSGKSYLLDTASAIATGQRCPVISAGRNEYETEARLSAVLITGQPLVSIDNLNGILRGDALCQFIERPRVQVRILGETRVVMIDSRTTIFGNGNNLTIAGDLVRRTINCRLDANMERPELRQFSARPFDRVLADRSRFVSAALTIVRAYLLAGCPGVLPALASFEEWSRLVRSALVWLGCADPAVTMEQARAEDPDRAILLEFIEGWRSDPSLATRRVTTGELRAMVEGGAAHHDDQSGLRAVLLKVAGQSDSGIDTVKLGRWLASQRGRVINGMKLCSEQDSHSKQHRWFLEQRSDTCG